MREDIKTNMDVDFDIALTAVGAYNSVDHGPGAIDMSCYRTAQFSVVIASMVALSTIDGKLQWSDEGLTGSTWTDDDGSTGNDTALTQIIAAEGAGTIASLNVVRPLGQFYRLLATVGTEAVVASTITVAGPKKSIDAEA